MIKLGLLVFIWTVAFVMERTTEFSLFQSFCILILTHLFMKSMGVKHNEK